MIEGIECTGHGSKSAGGHKKETGGEVEIEMEKTLQMAGEKQKITLRADILVRHAGFHKTSKWKPETRTSKA